MINQVFILVYVPVRQINTPCTDEQICAGGSTCVQNVCKCPKGKIFASDMCITVYGTSFKLFLLHTLN